MNIIEATAEALKVNGYIKRKGHPVYANTQAADLLADDWEVVSEGEGKCTEAETDKLTASVAIDTAELQEGIAELKVLPIFERKRDFTNLGDALQEHNYMRETEREFYFAEKLFRYDIYGSHRYDWYRIHESHIYTDGYIYSRNIKKLFTKILPQHSHIKYIPFGKLLNNLEPVSAAEFYTACVSQPQIEYLAKLKLYKMCRELIQDDYSELSNTQGNILKSLHITKNDLPYIQEYNMGYTDIKLYSRCKQYDISIFPDMRIIKEKCFGGTVDDVFFIMQFMSFDKIKEYVDSQLPAYKAKHTNNWYGRRTKEYYAGHILSDWKDYLENCISLEWNIEDTKVLKPKNLEERHDITVELMKLKENDIQQRDIRRRYYEYVYTLSYSDKNYSVIVPRTLEDFKYEGDNLHHCVYTNYASRAAKGKSIILLIRKNNEFYKPFVTLEINPNSYEKVQMRGMRNCIPDKEVQAFYNKYEKKILNKLKEQRRAA